MREQRLVFGEAAELYDRFRAGYPESVIADVLTFGGVTPTTVRALEVGAGTGKATAAFAVKIAEILALEPDPAMAELARQNTNGFPKVKIETSSFEDWTPDPGRFDLVFSAQAWHWIDPGVRYRKAAHALRNNGTLALFWHRTRWPEGDPVHNELETVYQRLVRDLLSRNPGFPGFRRPAVDSTWRDEISQTGLFADVTERSHHWSATFDADQFTGLLMTQSDHRLLAEDRRLRLLDEVGEVIGARGNQILVPHETFLVMAKRRST